jgi:integrase
MSESRAKAALAAAKKRGKTTMVVERTAASISKSLDKMVADLPEDAAAQAAIERVVRGLALRQPWFMRLIMEDDGTPLQPDTLTQDWFRKLADTSLPRIRFHDLRHAHATHMLSSGVHPKVASERLGHSKIGITLDLYSHVLPGMEADAAERVDAALQAAINKRTKTIG